MFFLLLLHKIFGGKEKTPNIDISNEINQQYGNSIVDSYTNIEKEEYITTYAEQNINNMPTISYPTQQIENPNLNHDI